MEVGRDAFSRGAYHRTCLANAAGPAGPAARRLECHWCGQRPRRVYRYLWLQDGRAHLPTDLAGPAVYCNFACFTACNVRPS